MFSDDIKPVLYNGAGGPASIFKANDQIFIGLFLGQP